MAPVGQRLRRPRRGRVVCQSVVGPGRRSLPERMGEAEILTIDRQNEVANCSVTSYRFEAAKGKHGKLVLDAFNFVAPLEQGGAPVTSEPDAPVAVK